MNKPAGHTNTQLLSARLYGLAHAVQSLLLAPEHAPHGAAHGWHTFMPASGWNPTGQVCAQVLLDR